MAGFYRNIELTASSGAMGGRTGRYQNIIVFEGSATIAPFVEVQGTRMTRNEDFNVSTYTPATSTVSLGTTFQQSQTYQVRVITEATFSNGTTTEVREISSVDGTSVLTRFRDAVGTAPVPNISRWVGVDQGSPTGGTSQGFSFPANTGFGPWQGAQGITLNSSGTPTEASCDPSQATCTVFRTRQVQEVFSGGTQPRLYTCEATSGAGASCPAVTLTGVDDLPVGSVGDTESRDLPTSGITRVSVTPTRANGGREDASVPNRDEAVNNIELIDQSIVVTSCSADRFGNVSVTTNFGTATGNVTTPNTSTNPTTKNITYSVSVATIPTGYFYEEDLPAVFNNLTHSNCPQDAGEVVAPVFDTNSARVNGDRVANGNTIVAEGGAAYTIQAPTCSSCVGGRVSTRSRFDGAGTFSAGEREHSWIYTNSAGSATYTIFVESSQ